jgi:hypothetical protein
MKKARDASSLLRLCRRNSQTLGALRKGQRRVVGWLLFVPIGSRAGRASGSKSTNESVASVRTRIFDRTVGGNGIESVAPAV